MVILIGVVLAIVAVALVLDPVIRPSVSGARPGGPAEEPDDPREARKELALAALKEIEFDRATGKLAESDYQSMLARYTKEAVEALRDAEAPAAAEVGAGANGNGHQPAAGVPGPIGDDAIERLIADARAASKGRRFCSNCGAVLEGSGRFCVECGARA